MNTMTRFGHVKDAATRTLLRTSRGDDDTIQNCLEYARSCLNEDQRVDTELPLETLSARETAIEHAEAAWNDDGDAQETINFLKAFWAA